MNSRYIDEIMEQPEALHRAIDNYTVSQRELMRLAGAIASNHFRNVILTGMGISYHSCYPLWLKFSQHAIAATWWDASELVHYAPDALAADTLLIVVSQSGESAELKRIIELDTRPGVVVSITNGLDNSVARWSDLSLNTDAGPETAVSTKTYVTGMALLHLLGLQLLGGDVETGKTKLYAVADCVAGFLDGWESSLQSPTEFLGPCDALAFLARGPSMASALAGALMAAEASRIFCAAFSSAQFRHGPVETVSQNFRAIIFAGNDANRHLNYQMADYLAACGGKTLVITPTPRQEVVPAGVVELPIAMAEPEILPILEIIPVQLLTITLAHTKGYEPAAFINCNKVTLEE
jgi:glucosamine--fructose-6-phosphate aminotransferase (isomerizing)